MKLIINADDFGMTKSCTKAIFDAFNQNLITDTTMVANGEAFDFANELSKGHKIRESIGIHFNLTEGIPLTEDIKKCAKFAKGGRFHGKVNRLKPLLKSERQAVYEELTAQIEKIEKAGISVTHADSHHHIHTAVFIVPVVLKVCKEHGIEKLRLHRNIGNISAGKKIVKKIYNCCLKSKGFKTTEYFGSLEDITTGLPSGITEIMVHPDYDERGVLIDRVDMENENPIGKDLSEYKGKIIKNQSSYREF